DRRLRQRHGRGGRGVVSRPRGRGVAAPSRLGAGPRRRGDARPGLRLAPPLQRAPGRGGEAECPRGGRRLARRAPLLDALRHGMTHPEIVSSRLLHAPREEVFRAFTDAEVLARWWGPAGFANTFEEFAPRAGGAWRFVMRGPDGAEFRMAKRFVEV